MLAMTEEAKGEYYTPEEVAEMLTIAPESVARLLRQGKMPGYKFGGSWRIDKQEFARYREAQRNKYPLDQES